MSGKFSYIKLMVGLVLLCAVKTKAYGPPPTTLATCSVQVCTVGEPIFFDASASHPNCYGLNKCTPPKWEWDFDYNGTFVPNQLAGTTSPYVYHSYSQPGTYTVAVLYTDYNGTSGDISTMTITAGVGGAITINSVTPPSSTTEMTSGVNSINVTVNYTVSGSGGVIEYIVDGVNLGQAFVTGTNNWSTSIASAGSHTITLSNPTNGQYASYSYYINPAGTEYYNGSVAVSQVYFWNHYVPYSPRYLCSWPNVCDLNDAKNLYGFSKIIVNPGGEQSAVQVFGASNVITNLGSLSTLGFVTTGSLGPTIVNANSQGVTSFYVDEPGWATDGEQTSKMASVVNVVKDGAPNNKVYAADYRSNCCASYYDAQCIAQGLVGIGWDPGAVALADVVGCDMYEAYGDCANSSTVICDYAYFSEHYPSQFGFVWMDNSSADRSGWGAFFNYLNTNGISGAWLYFNQSSPPQENELLQFVNTAFENDFLQEVDQEWNIYWSCDVTSTNYHPQSWGGTYSQGVLYEVSVNSGFGDVYLNGSRTWGATSFAPIVPSIYSQPYLYGSSQSSERASSPHRVEIAAEEETSAPVPKSYGLSQNYPNPFNPSTIINYQLPAAGNVTLKVYDVLGRLVKTLVDRDESAGYYNVVFNASEFPSGIYFYKLTAGAFSSTKKFIVLK